jgi:hypothetical protein
MKTAGGDVKVKLADGDAKTTYAEVTEAKNPTK